MADTAMLPSLERLADDAHPVLSLAAASAVVSIDSGQIGGFITRVASRGDWAPLPVERVLLAQRGLKTLYALGRAIQAAPAADKPRLVRYLANGAAGPARAYVRDLAAVSDDSEVVSACLKVLATFADSADAEFVGGFLAADEFVVRLQAVRALGRMARPEDAERLRPFLCAPEWWLRYRAAEAMVRIAEASDRDLADVAGLTPDEPLLPILEQAREDHQAENASRAA
jgi:HEAT repeat protein